MKKSNFLPRKTLFITSKRAKSTKEGEEKKTVERDCHIDLIHNRGIQADYRTDCATRTLMVVPDKEMDDFRRVFDLSAATGDVTTAPPEVGAAVRVARGPLTGVVGHVSGYRGRVHVVVSLMDLLYATAEVPATWLEPLG